MVIFRFFRMAAAAMLDLLKFQIYNSQTGQEVRSVPPCQNLWRWVKPLSRYGDFSIFHDGGRRHLGFLKFQIFKGQMVQQAAAILDFKNFKLLMVERVKRVELRHHAKFHGDF